jgi:predicted dehydrogenase
MIRLALVGCRAVAEEEHLPAIRGLRNVGVVAVADPNLRRLEHVANRFQITARYRNVDDLLSHPGVDAVGICVPAPVHRQVILPVLAAGKHVLIEKPPGVSLDDIDEIIAHARRSPGKVMVGDHMRWHRLLRQARHFLATGALRPIESIRVVWYGPHDDRDLPAWRERRELGGGALLETAV